MCLVPAPGQTQSRNKPSITPPPYSHRTGFVLDLFSFYLSFISPQQHRGKKNIECSWRWSYVLGRSLVEVPSTLRSNKTKTRIWKIDKFPGPAERSKYWGGNPLLRSIFIRFSKFFFSLKAVERANYWGGKLPPLPPQFRRPCTSFECPSKWVQNTRRTDLQLFKKCVFY